MSGGYGPVGLIKSVLKCDDETARTVAKNLAGPLAHEPTRAFLSIAWHLSNTTIPAGGKGGDRAVYINEGKRQAGLFMVACAQQGLDLSTYSEPKE